MPHRSTEPRRATKRAPTSADRTGAGCLAIFTLPWTLGAMFGAFMSAGAPLVSGLSGVIGGFVTLALLVPIVALLVSVTWSGFRVASGESEKVELFSPVIGGSLAGSVVILFVLATIITLLKALVASLGGALDVAAIFGLIGGSGVIATGGYMLGKQLSRERWERAVRRRRRHDKRPAPPWEHPLGRTEPASMLTEAITNQYNVILLFAAVALSLILWNPLPAFVAGGLELFYLALVPDTKWFQRVVDADQLAWAEELARERREEQLEYLTDEQVGLHQQLVATANAARGALEASNYPFDLQKIDRIIDHHLWLMELENYYSDLDDADLRAELQGKIDDVAVLRRSAEGRMADVLEQRASVLERRLNQLERITGHVDEIREQRLGLQDALRLLSESALGAGATSSEEIDEVLYHLELTEEVVLDFHAEEQDLEAEIERVAAEAGVAS